MKKRKLSTILLALSIFTPPLYGQREDNYPPDDVTVKFEKTNLPIVMLTVDGKMIQKKERITARMKVITNSTGFNYADTLKYPNQQIDYEGYVGLKYRGNSSFVWSDKKSYSIHLISDSIEKGGLSVKSDIMGMGEDNDWVLIAPYQDRSMMRDVLTFELGREYSEYVPECRYCEVFLDGIYYGVYIMAEHIRRGKYRLDLKKPKEEGDALTGGYLLYVNDGSDVFFVSDYHPVDSTGIAYIDREIKMEYADPDDDITEMQKSYIQQAVRRFEDVIDNKDFQLIQNYIDVISFIDYQLETELSNNSDGYRKSTYLYKYRDSVDPRFKLAIWDMNLAYGNSHGKNAHRTDIWRYKQNNTHYADKDINLIPFWWYRLNEMPYYKKQLENRWSQYRNGSYSDAGIIHKIDSLVTVLNTNGAQERNSRAWPRWGVPIHGSSYASESYDVEIERLKTWILDRAQWIDSQLISSTAIQEVGAESDGVVIYSLCGTRLSKPQKGINIIIEGNCCRKIFVR